jgi:hypothetical protein
MYPKRMVILIVILHFLTCLLRVNMGHQKSDIIQKRSIRQYASNSNLFKDEQKNLANRDTARKYNRVS